MFNGMRRVYGVHACIGHSGEIRHAAYQIRGALRIYVKPDFPPAFHIKAAFAQHMILAAANVENCLFFRHAASSLFCFFTSCACGKSAFFPCTTRAGIRLRCRQIGYSFPITRSSKEAAE